MKAVIMAGGKGTRLLPLTSHTPKPMVPLLNRPCMEYIIDLLVAHGITEIAVTVQYLPEVIKSYFGDGSDFGVSLTYFEETTPLGTAGSIKNCGDFLDERFIVISGDALTDFDLSEVIAYHERKQALATLLLTKVDDPLEFGMVMTEEDGKINRFLEKPSWSEVFSDTVNTGIYILEPEILSYIPQEREFDFSKDVFPQLLQAKQPMYGVVANGYWSDIGSLEVYRKTQFDMLDSKVQVKIKAQEIAPRIYLEQGVRIDTSVRIEGPAYIGEKTYLQMGASIGAYSVIGTNGLLSGGAKLSQTILWENVYIANRAELTGTTIGRNVSVYESAVVSDGTLIGDQCRIGAKAHVRPRVKIWPQKDIEQGATVTTSLIYGNKLTKCLFGHRGIKGVANLDITPEFVSRLASAYAYLLKQGSKIAVSACSHPFSQLLKHSLLTSLCSSGVDTIDFGVAITPVTRYGVKSFNCHGGIHLSMQEKANEKIMLIEFFDHNGIPVSRDFQKRINTAYWQETYARSLTDQLGNLQIEHGVEVAYLQALSHEIDTDVIRRRRIKVLVDSEQRYLVTFLTPFLASIGVDVTFRTIQEGVLNHQADLGFQLDKNGEHFYLFTETGERLATEKLLALQLIACFQHKSISRIGLPVSAPEEVEHIARISNVEIVRTKVSPRAMMEVAIDAKFQPFFDAIYSLVKILEWMAKEEKCLSQLVEPLPACYMERKTVSCPLHFKGKVMRRMMEDVKGEQVELVDGIKVYEKEGWVLILPDSEEAEVAIISQGTSQQNASLLATSFAKRIYEYQQMQENR
ncbi:sugar phosphate nucleotidyltransferase [Brevibacillus sp. SYSU BS000544]|uniref:sugar phosphate nucleotidyltransferase n=1 Tax=Brevibacillus sp. SYSU BS000544 TaxID=3416443 RepID=UPI003CE587AD